MKQVVLSLGSNMGKKSKNLDKAVEMLSYLLKTEIVDTSKIYETDPVGVPDTQEKYCNCCVLLETELSPELLMGACLGVEAAMGRQRPYRNAPRIIDIDIILYEGVERNTQELTIPHPRFREREFVLRPMLDLFPTGNVFGFDIRGMLELLG